MSQRLSSIKKILQYQKVRFVLVGIANTLVDFSVLIFLVSIVGLASAPANIISTSCALVISYILNKKAVFGDTDTDNRRQLVLFISVTLVGIWLIQTVILVSVEQLLQQWVGAGLGILIMAKMVGIVASLVWNFFWYSKVVFRQGNPSKK